MSAFINMRKLAKKGFVELCFIIFKGAIISEEKCIQCNSMLKFALGILYAPNYTKAPVKEYCAKNNILTYVDVIFSAFSNDAKEYNSWDYQWMDNWLLATSSALQVAK